MPAAIARVSCPVCRTEFQTYVEQVLDSRVDPGVKNRVLSGAVNVAICPRCGNGGALDLPFIYHDPEHEIALLYLPMQSGRSELERQRYAGTLTQQLMNTLAPEERKGYLFQPETFITMESFVRRALEIEGVTEEEVKRSQDQRALISRLLEAEPEDWDALVEQDADLIDESFFGLLQYLLQMSGAAEQPSAEEDDEVRESVELQRLRGLYGYLVANHPVGQRLSERTDVLRVFADNPSAETLLEALAAAADEETVDMLVQMGITLMDYRFFQLLLQRVETAETPEQEERLKTLRRQVLDAREKLSKAGQDLARDRLGLLERLIASEDPLKMARSHLSELDDSFMYLLQAQLRDAQQRKDEPLLQALNRIVGILNRLSEESMPPEMLFIRRALSAPDEPQLLAFLNDNKPMLQPQLFGFLEDLEAETRQRGEVEVADRLSAIRAKAQKVAGIGEDTPLQLDLSSGTGSSVAVDPDGKQTPSGLIISRR